MKTGTGFRGSPLCYDVRVLKALPIHDPAGGKDHRRYQDGNAVFRGQQGRGDIFGR
jgi:hypothetical protein